MKKVILASVLAVAAVSGGAQAATTSICAGSGGSATVTAATDGTAFVRATFSAKCSNNVYMVGDDMLTYYRAGAASLKGKNAFGLSSTGGAFTTAACAATGCTLSNASGQATSAPSN